MIVAAILTSAAVGAVEANERPGYGRLRHEEGEHERREDAQHRAERTPPSTQPLRHGPSIAFVRPAAKLPASMVQPAAGVEAGHRGWIGLPMMLWGRLN